MATRRKSTGRLDPIHRRVAWELLEGLTGHVHLAHELYRVAHHHRDGLTDKEYDFLIKRYEVLKEESSKMRKLKDRLKGSLDG